MADLDWNQCDAVESIPGKVSGAWVFKDTRMPVSIVFSNLQAGASIEELIEWFDVTREQVEAVLGFVARSADAPADRATAEILRVRAEAAEIDHAHSVR
jgi:uncharacterized protein (DUF433 family)